MPAEKTSKPSIRDAYVLTFQTFKKSPSIYLPFLIFAGIELAFLMLLFLAPRQPLRPLLGPPIDRFFGERFLHYPLNFLILPKMISQVRVVLTVLVGSLMTGTAVLMTIKTYAKQTAEFKPSLRSAAKNYIALFCIVLFITVLFQLAIRVTSALMLKYFVSGHAKFLFVPAKIWLGPILTVINIILGIFIQAVFIYAIPALLNENKRLVPALARGLNVFGKLFAPTMILVILPMIVYIPIIVLNYNILYLVNNVFPESVLLLLLASTVISSLFIDPLITVSTANLYLNSGRSKE